MNLSDYVEKRNGVPLGSNKSLKNMLFRSLGATNFSIFWRYWNPIWSYYLGKYIFKPLRTILPKSIALMLTFGFCGFVHDLIIILIRWELKLLFTPWFLIMCLWLIASDAINIDYSNYSWSTRATINLLAISSSLILALQF